MSEQIQATVICKTEGIRYELRHDTGNTLLESMREGTVVLPSLCGGMGKCGRCIVKFQGYAPLPTQTERLIIEPEKIRAGYRLACMARPKRECIVEADFVGNRAEEEQSLHVLTGYYGADKERRMETCIDDIRAAAGRQDGVPEKTDDRTFAAADIGTTTIAMQLLETDSGRILDTFTCLNPQRSYGMDVISRIRAADEGQGDILRKLVRDVLSAGWEQLKKSAENQGVREPEFLSIACNTAMGHIFMGYPAGNLGKSPFLPVSIKTAAVEWNGIRAALAPGISAFVGGDILAGLYACGLCRPVSWSCAQNGVGGREDSAAEDDAAWLFMDLGTNAEMVMGTGSRAAATAAAAGSAFEGRGKDGTAGSERLRAVAYLLEKGIVDETGLLAEPYFETGIAVQAGEGRNSVFITQEDIRDIQMAKAAVRSGIHFLMKKMDIQDYGRINKVYMAGGMGFYLDKRSAVRTGLLPAELEERIETVGNAALAGAALFGRKGWEESSREMEAFADVVNAFNMAELAEFEEVYIGYMNFDCKIL